MLTFTSPNEQKTLSWVGLFGSLLLLLLPAPLFFGSVTQLSACGSSSTTVPLESK